MATNYQYLCPHWMILSKRVNLESCCGNVCFMCGVDLMKRWKNAGHTFNKCASILIFTGLESDAELNDLSMPRNYPPGIIRWTNQSAGRDQTIHGNFEDQFTTNRSSWCFWAPAPITVIRIIKPFYRINQFLFGYSPNRKILSGNNPFHNYHWSQRIVDEITLWWTSDHRAKKADDALKTALAYDRGWAFSIHPSSSTKASPRNPNADPKKSKLFN